MQPLFSSEMNLSFYIMATRLWDGKSPIKERSFFACIDSPFGLIRYLCSNAESNTAASRFASSWTRTSRHSSAASAKDRSTNALSSVSRKKLCGSLMSKAISTSAKTRSRTSMIRFAESHNTSRTPAFKDSS